MGRQSRSFEYSGLDRSVELQRLDGSVELQRLDGSVELQGLDGPIEPSLAPRPRPGASLMLFAFASLGAAPSLPAALRIPPGGVGSAASTIEANAAPARVAVLPVLAGDGQDLTVGAVFAGAERAGAFRSVRMMSVDDYFFQDGKELSSRAVACGGNTECLADALAAFQADLGLVVIANATIEPPLFGLVMIDTARRRVMAESYDTLEPDEVENQVARGAGALLDQIGLGRSGRLELIVQPPSAVIEVDAGRIPDPGATHRFTLPPGPHRVRVSAPDHQPSERVVEVRAGEITQLDVRLEDRASLWSSPWLWGGVAAAVVVAAGTTAALIAAESSRDCLCVTAVGDGMCLACP